MGVSVVFAQTLKLIQALQGAANDEQRARVLPKIKDDARCVLAIGMTEPQTSSNYIIPYGPAAFVTNATRKGQGWVINGKKRFISNGNRARFYMLFAQTNPGQGAERRQHLLPDRARHARLHHRARRRQDGRTARQQRRADLQRLLRAGRGRARRGRSRLRGDLAVLPGEQRLRRRQRARRGGRGLRTIARHGRGSASRAASRSSSTTSSPRSWPKCTC